MNMKGIGIDSALKGLEKTINTLENLDAGTRLNEFIDCFQDPNKIDHFKAVGIVLEAIADLHAPLGEVRDTVVPVFEQIFGEISFKDIAGALETVGHVFGELASRPEKFSAQDWVQVALIGSRLVIAATLVTSNPVGAAVALAQALGMAATWLSMTDTEINASANLPDAFSQPYDNKYAGDPAQVGDRYW